MKAHIGVDSSAGLVHSVSATTAKDHDITQFDNILHGEDKAKRRKRLSFSQNKRNLELSSFRAKVKYPFQIIKYQWKYQKARYLEILKNFSQLFFLLGLSNIFKVRKTLSLVH